MYGMNGLGATAADADDVRNAIRRARGSAYGGWQPYETAELERTLNSKLVPLGYRPIPTSGAYGPTLCAAVDAIFGAGSPTANSLKSEIGSACLRPGQPLTRTTMADEQLIIFDDEATPAPVTPAPAPVVPGKRLDDFCNVPPGVCAETEQLAAAIRGAASASCDYYQRFEGPLPPRVKGYSTNGLGGIDCPPAGTTRVSPANLSVFMQNYSPCQLKNIQACPPPPPTPFTPCNAGNKACIDSNSPDILDTAVTQCQFNVTPRGDASPCPAPNGLVTHANAHRFEPCELARIPMCPELEMDIPVPFAPLDEPGEEEDDDNTKYIVGGILGLLVVGGIAYAATRKRKKGKRRK